MEIEKVKIEVARILKKELQGSGLSAFFFGSRVTGTNTDRSDLDVGIEGSSAVPDAILRSIKAQCAVIPTLYTIDIVDFSFLSEEFKKVAKTKVERVM